MSWEKYTPRTRSGDVVYVLKQGHFFVSKSIIDNHFQDMTHVVLSYDKAHNLIALKPTKETSNTLKISKMGQGSYEVSGVGFLGRFGLDGIRGKRFKPIYQDDLIIIDLAKELI